MKNFSGRLYGTRLFAGRLFRAPAATPAGPGGPSPTFSLTRTEPWPKRRRRDSDDDVFLLFIRR